MSAGQTAIQICEMVQKLPAKIQNYDSTAQGGESRYKQSRDDTINYKGIKVNYIDLLDKNTDSVTVYGN